MKRLVKAVIDEEEGREYVIVSRAKLDGKTIYLGESRDNKKKVFLDNEIVRLEG
jgi:hypothetical protein